LLADIGCSYAAIASGKPLRDVAFAAAAKLVAVTRPSAP
jgi:hypothetical protein